MTRILTSHLSHVELYLHNYVGAPKLIKIRGSLSLVIRLISVETIQHMCELDFVHTYA